MRRTYYYPVWRDGKLKAFTMSYDDGNDCDAKLCSLMRACGVRGTFNVNSELMPAEPVVTDKPWHRMTAEECREVYGDDMEIAVHGASHPYWMRLPDGTETADILDDRRALERMTGRIVRGAASPNGSQDADTAAALRACGIEYCRTTRRAAGFNFPKDFEDEQLGFLALKTTAHNTDENLMEHLSEFLEGTPRMAGRWLFYLWGHSYEFCRGGWEPIEAVLKAVGGREDVWFATNIEIFDYERAVRALRFDVDQTRVENPSAIPVWLQDCRAQTPPFAVPAGKTVELPKLW